MTDRPEPAPAPALVVGAELPVAGPGTLVTTRVQADPLAGLDLPLRLLVRSDDGTTRPAFRDPRAPADDVAVGDRVDVLDPLRRRAAGAAPSEPGRAHGADRPTVAALRRAAEGRLRP